MEPRKQLGNRSEQLARMFLEQKGYTIVQSNFSCATGEIDVIARQANTLVFLEVRSKTSAQYGQPGETVNEKKQRKLRRAAQYYLYIHPELNHCFCRFDVIAILWQNGQARLQWFSDAFQ